MITLQEYLNNNIIDLGGKRGVANSASVSKQGELFLGTRHHKSVIILTATA